MSEMEGEHDTAHASAVAANPKCFALTIFTQQYRDVRDFYVDILNAHVTGEKPDRACELELGGVPLCLRACEHGELVSYFHLHLALKNQDSVLGELRRRGIIVTTVGQYNNFRDPEGRIIKLSEERTSVS
jgi:catechol 2,3-dioxygenase-like lactoylglutathione lyase family enzyme